MIISTKILPIETTMQATSVTIYPSTKQCSTVEGEITFDDLTCPTVFCWWDGKLRYCHLGDSSAGITLRSNGSSVFEDDRKRYLLDSRIVAKIAESCIAIF